MPRQTWSFKIRPLLLTNRIRTAYAVRCHSQRKAITTRFALKMQSCGKLVKASPCSSNLSSISYIWWSSCRSSTFFRVRSWCIMHTKKSRSSNQMMTLLPYSLLAPLSITSKKMNTNISTFKKGKIRFIPSRVFLLQPWRFLSFS